MNITCSGIHDKPNFQLCPERKGFASKGVLNIYQMDRPQAKTTLTVMFTFSANGDITPSMITCLNRWLQILMTSVLGAEGPTEYFMNFMSV